MLCSISNLIIKEFAKQVGRTFYNTPSLVPQTSWDDAFDELTEAINNVPKSK